MVLYENKKSLYTWEKCEMKMKIVPQIRDALKILDSVIEDAYSSDEPDDVLARAYFSMIEVLRHYVCTANNAGKFSEFFYFRYVKYYLEKNLSKNGLKVEFKEKQIQNLKSSYFRSECNGKKLILKSDLSAKKAGISGRPDIFVGIQEDEHSVRPIAIFEIKVAPKEDITIMNLIERFKKFKESVIAKFPGMTEKELPYFVWVYLNHALYANVDRRDFIKEFCNLSSDNHCVVIHNVTQWDNNDYKYTFTGEINTIMEKIVEKIRANDFL